MNFIDQKMQDELDLVLRSFDAFYIFVILKIPDNYETFFTTYFEAD